MIVDRETVAFVANALQKVQSLGARGNSIGAERPGTNTSSNCLARAATGISSPNRAFLELLLLHPTALYRHQQPKAAADRRTFQELHPALLFRREDFESSVQHFLHGCKVVVSCDITDFEVIIFTLTARRLPGPPLSPRSQSLEVAHVITLNPQVHWVAPSGLAALATLALTVVISAFRR